MRKIALISTAALGAVAYASGDGTKPAAATKPATAAASNAPRVDPKVAFGVVEGFTPPARPARGGNASKYPFDSLEPGQYFSVANKTRRQMASPLNNANKKYRNELTDATGKKSTNQEREFYSVDVDAATADKFKGTAHEGAKVLIVRSK